MKIADRLSRPTIDQEGTRHSAKASSRGGALLDQLFEDIYTEVVDSLDLRRANHLDAEELRQQVDPLVRELLASRNVTLSSRRRQRLVGAIVDEILGLGPLEALLADPSISDILINAPDQVYIERGGVLEESKIRFRDDAHLLNTINRIVAPIGRRIDESSPMVDARLPDGSRVNAVIPPLAIDGPVLSIRRFRSGPMSLRELVDAGALNASMAHYLRSAVRAKCSILVCGGTGAGKTTLLNALSRYISSRERVVTIEDSAELQLQQKHVVRLEARPPNIEGRGEVTIRDLVRNSLRMRPDRIIVGEVRASEVLDMVQAMNTGHEGSMTTVHANSVGDAFTRLMSMLSMAGTQLSEPMMAQMVGRAIDVVVSVVRDMDGRRRISELAEVTGVQHRDLSFDPVFVYDPQVERSSSGWRCSGRSTLLRRFELAGYPLDQRWLR